MKRPKKFNSEENLHQQAADHLRLKYPNTLYRTDFAAGIKMTIGQAAKHKRLQACRAWPDIFLAEPRTFQTYNKEFPGLDTHHYCGLFIELKKEGTTIYKKNGELVANEHIREQAAILEQLRKAGYYAEFAIGLDQARALIDCYLKGYTVPASATNH